MTKHQYHYLITLIDHATLQLARSRTSLHDHQINLTDLKSALTNLKEFLPQCQPTPKPKTTAST